MTRIPKGRYAKEFREEAVKLVMEEGMYRVEADRRLGQNSHLLPVPEEALEAHMYTRCSRIPLHSATANDGCRKL